MRASGVGEVALLAAGADDFLHASGWLEGFADEAAQEVTVLFGGTIGGAVVAFEEAGIRVHSPF